MRPIELQFALHKNDEVGLLQNQLNHKPQQDQAQLADASVKQSEKQRRTVGKADDVHHASVQDQEKDKQGERKQKARSKRNEAVPVDSNPALRSEHPFKGKHIDLSL